jgi:GABA(A) receptor-associated protein
MSYKSTTTLEQRTSESKRIKERYPDRIPIIVEINRGYTQDLPELDKNKYLVPGDLTLGQFIYVLRKRIKIDSAKAIFLMTEDGQLMPTHTLLSSIYDEKCENTDGFLFLVLSSESVFG